MASTPDRQIKVLIVDDSIVAREFLRFVIESDPDLKVIGYATDGEKALQLLQKSSPDVVTMDIAMPGLDGFETTRRIMQTKPLPVIIVSGLYSQHDVDASFRAMDAGALAIIPRPVGFNDPQYESMAKNLIETIKVSAGIKVVTRHKQREYPKEIGSVDNKTNNIIEAVAIGASLGGPPALELILSSLPASFPVPIFIVQHISNGFAKGLADWLQRASKLVVKLPKDQEKALPGHVYVAPDGVHMELKRKNEIALVPGCGKGLCPSINRLFHSMALAYGSHALGVILTGMGKDGAEELLLMKQKGAYTFVQDAESCVMPSMPKAALEIGATKSTIPLEQIASTIELLVNTSRL